MLLEGAHADDAGMLAHGVDVARLVQPAGDDRDEIAAPVRDVGRVGAGAGLALDGVVLGEVAGLERVGEDLDGGTLNHLRSTTHQANCWRL